MKKKILKITLSVVLILILAVGIGLAYLVGAAGGGGPFDFVWKNKLKKMPGNAEKYSLENVEEQLSIADGAVIGTTFKRDGQFYNEVDEARVKKFMEKVKELRK